MQYKSVVFLVVVFSICSADLFMFSGRSSRPAGALAIYNLLLGTQVGVGHLAAGGDQPDVMILENKETKSEIVVAYHANHANNSRHFGRLANLSK